MRNIVEVKTIYTFEELDESARENAMRNLEDKLADWNDWWEELKNEQLEELEEIGLNNAKISFSLAYVQGDFCRIEGEIDVVKLMNHIDPKNGIDFEKIDIYEAKLNHRGFEFCADCSDEEYNKIYNTILDWRYDKEYDFYWQYRKEYEEQTSEENLADMADANDFEFDEEGEIV